MFDSPFGVNRLECHIRCLTSTISRLISYIMSYKYKFGKCTNPSGFQYMGVTEILCEVFFIDGYPS